jgi:4-amino-4-deoxy-L-arabinose transferase-like glycosyltransferase
VSAGVSRSLLVVLAIAVAALAVTSVRLDSATGDEGAHIAAGVIKLRYGWLSFFPEQPPLMNAISALPLRRFTMPPAWRANLGQRGHWAAGHALLYEAGNDAPRLLLLARLPTIALFLALCFAVYFVVARETTRGWGVVAFALTGFCPTLLAHGRLATVDLGVTAFVFIAFALWLRVLGSAGVPPADVTASRAVTLSAESRGRRRGTAPHQPARDASAPLAGVVAMCALLSKTSGVIVVPFLAIVTILHVWRTRLWRPLLASLGAAIAAAIVTLYAVTFALASPEYLAAAFPHTPRLAIPWLQYQLHADAIRFWYTAGHEHPQFLLGQFSRTGWPQYYPIAFLLKTPVPALLLFIGALVASLRRRSLVVDSSLLFIAAFFAIAATSRIDLGIRYILPVYPFLYTAIAIALSRMAIDARRSIAIGVLVAWHCLASLVAWPSYLSYFNELIGSPRNADRFLIDSNLDWGQDLHRLRLWSDAHGVDFLRIDYFGGGDVAYEFGAKGERWTAPRPERLPPGWFAVSRHLYRVSFDPTESPVDYDTYLALSKARYVTTVGGSIDVYRVE